MVQSQAPQAGHRQLRSQSELCQHAGFRVVAVEPDYFLQHYPEPLFENGLQHRDRLRLALEL